MWTDEQIALLKSLRAAGVTFSDIARRLGVTRNSAIGKSRRMGLATPSVSAPRDPKPKPTPEPEPEPMPELAHTDPVRLMDTVNTIRECRWPLWDLEDRDGDFMVCGAPTVDGASWCKTHRRLAFSPQPKKRDAA